MEPSIPSSMEHNGENANKIIMAYEKFISSVDNNDDPKNSFVI